MPARGLVGLVEKSLSSCTAMTHILVKWVTERKYDVYPLRCLTDAVIGYRLSQQDKCIEEYRGTIVTVKWNVHEEPAPATLLDVGKSAFSSLPSEIA